MLMSFILWLDRIFPAVTIAGLAAELVIILAHYFIFGPSHPELRKEKNNIHRFNICERGIHIITLASFVILAVTGFLAAVFYDGLTGWMRAVHIVSAPVFAASLFFVALTWAQDCCFAKYDLQWAIACGGYFGGDDPPAGRFNAGQKGFFWVIVILALCCMVSGVGMACWLFGSILQQISFQVHRYVSLFMLMVVTAHIYLGTFANPGTWQIILSGYVSFPWAKHHHSVWCEKIDKSSKAH